MNIFHGRWWWSWRFLGTFQCWDHIGVLFPPIFATGIQMLASQCFIHDILVLLCLRTFYPLLCYIKYSTLFIFLFRADLRLKKIKRKGHEIGLLITLKSNVMEFFCYFNLLLHVWKYDRKQMSCCTLYTEKLIKKIKPYNIKQY